MAIRIEICADRQTLLVDGKQWMPDDFPVSEATSKLHPESAHDGFIEADPGCTGFHQLLQIASQFSGRP